MTMPGIDLPEGCGIPLTGDTMCCTMTAWAEKLDQMWPTLVPTNLVTLCEFLQDK